MVTVREFPAASFTLINICPLAVFGAIPVKFTVFHEVDPRFTVPEAIDILVTVTFSLKVTLPEKDDHRVARVTIDSDDFDGAMVSSVIVAVFQTACTFGVDALSFVYT